VWDSAQQLRAAVETGLSSPMTRGVLRYQVPVSLAASASPVPFAPLRLFQFSLFSLPFPAGEISFSSPLSV
jgi:hypothetical protein